MKLSGVKKVRVIMGMYERQGGLCVYCGRTMLLDAPQKSKLRATIDHRVPLHAGGTWAKANLLLSCRKCNSYKGCVVIPDWLWDNPELLREIFRSKRIHEIKDISYEGELPREERAPQTV